MSSNKGWIGVDLDGTLAYYDHWRGSDHIGEPVKRMVDRVKKWLEEGREVRIFTARVSPQAIELNNDSYVAVHGYIADWCKKHIGRELPITHEKDMAMIELWDDRCVTVFPNSGRAWHEFWEKNDV